MSDEDGSDPECESGVADPLMKTKSETPCVHSLLFIKTPIGFSGSMLYAVVQVNEACREC